MTGVEVQGQGSCEVFLVQLCEEKDQLGLRITVIRTQLCESKGALAGDGGRFRNWVRQDFGLQFYRSAIHRYHNIYDPL